MPVQAALEALVDQFAGRLDLGLPPAIDRGGHGDSADRAWHEGVEVERLRALSLLIQLREATTGSADRAYDVLNLGAGMALESADRWREYYRQAGSASGRFALLARAEVSARLACSLREAADRALDAATAA